MCVKRFTWRVPHLEQKLLTLPEHLCSPAFSRLRVVRSLMFCVMFWWSLVVLLSFSFWPWCCLFFCLLTMVLSVLLSFDHGVVCSSVFWPWCCLFFCLLTMVLSVLLSFDHGVVCSSVFWPWCCLSFFFWPWCCLSFFFWPWCCLYVCISICPSGSACVVDLFARKS